MPGGDRTGPWGRGPLSGRRMGLCATLSSPFTRFIRARQGAGWRVSPIGDRSIAPEERSGLNEELSQLRQQLSRLEKKLGQKDD